MATQQADPEQVVVVGSSAGGIEALSTLVSTLPANFPAPVVIAQHLDPQRPSHLAEILARHCTLPVIGVERQATLAAGHVYVIPPDREVEMRDGHLILRATDGRERETRQRARVPERQTVRPTPSINALFRSAAHTFGDGVIAVVLSGTGSDGAAGALEVKKAGGTVIIQNPQTASYPAMPLSLAPTAVDLVANTDEMGALLYGLLTGATTALEQPDADKALRALLSEVREHTGINFVGYRTPTILRRIARRMAATNCSTLDSYRRYLPQHPEEYAKLVSAFLIKVTEFFRDPPVFAALRAEVLPAVIAYAREHGRQVRIWSAGCATGEEAYSVAMQLAELLGAELDEWSVRIFATDLDREAIGFARRGRYTEAALADVPAELVGRYFVPSGDDFEVTKRIRNLVIFGEHDLLQRPPFPHIDLVLCRNVLMYMTSELQQHVLQLFAYSLRDGGYLVLGKAETTHPLPHYFAPVQAALRIYRRQGDRLPVPARKFIESLAMGPAARGPSAGAVTGAAGEATAPAHALLTRGGLGPLPRAPRERTPSELAAERLGGLMLDLPVGVVIVDHEYRVQAINTLALRLFGINREALGTDLLHLIRGVPMEALRDLIDRSLRDASALPLSQTLQTTAENGQQRHLQLTGYAHHLQAGEVAIGGESALLLISDVTAAVAEQAAAEQAREQSAQAQQETAEGAAARNQEQMATMAAQLRRMETINQDLRDANQAYAKSVLELRHSNEELQVDAEEMQAASEEVETLNEELQATNEELETLNEEQQATLEELRTANDDLEARGRELSEAATTQERMRLQSERERARLAAILGGMTDAVLVVDATGHALVTNAAYDRLFGSGAGVGGGTGQGGQATPPPGLPASAAGREEHWQDEHGQPLAPSDTPQQRASRGETFSMVFARVSAQGEQQWYEANGQPLPPEVGLPPSGIVLIRDITDRSFRRLQEAFLTVASHELRTPMSVLTIGLQSIEQRLPPPKQDKTDIRRPFTAVTAAAESLDGLVTDLVDAARLRTGKVRLDLQAVDLVPLARAAVQAAQLLALEGQQITIAVDVPALVVRGDPLRLRQVLMNLLTNAIRHAPTSPRIEVRLRRVAGAAGVAELQVHDEGPGIPAADLPHIFSRFYQVMLEEQGASQRGLGLGLYITRELVSAHGGEISVTSSEGKGTTFTIHLPLLPANGGTARPPS